MLLLQINFSHKINIYNVATQKIVCVNFNIKKEYIFKLFFISDFF